MDELLMGGSLAACGAGGATLLLRHTLAKYRIQISSLSKRISELETERIAVTEQRLKAIEEQIATMVKGDKQGVILATVSPLVGQIEKLSDKIDRLADMTSRQSAQITATDRYLENVDKALQTHIGGSKHDGN